MYNSQYLIEAQCRSKVTPVTCGPPSSMGAGSRQSLGEIDQLATCNLATSVWSYRLE